MNRVPDHGLETLVVNMAVGEHVCEIYRAKIAGLIWKQGLFATGIGAFDPPDLRRGIVPVHGIYEDDARFAVFPGGLTILSKTSRADSFSISLPLRG